jgi:hypothetical protein
MGMDWMDGGLDGWMDGWMDGWRDGWMDGWMWMDVDGWNRWNGWTDGIFGFGIDCLFIVGPTPLHNCMVLSQTNSYCRAKR